MARVVLSPAAQKDLDGLPMHLNAQVQNIFERLIHWPKVSGAKPLRGGLKGCFRIRMGDHRVQFMVIGDAVVIQKIGKRDRFYE